MSALKEQSHVLNLYWKGIWIMSLVMFLIKKSKDAVSVTKKNMVKHYSHSYSLVYITNVDYVHKWRPRNYPLIIWLIFPTNLLNIEKN